MAYRKLRAKKYNGIFEYYNPKDKDRVTKSLYLSYRDEFKKNKMKKLSTMDLNEAIEERDKIKADVRAKIKTFEADSRKIEIAIKSKTLTLNQMADLFFTNRTAKNNIKESQVYTNRIKPILGEMLVSKISKEEIEKLVKKLGEKYASKTINNTVDLLSEMFNTFIKKKKIDSNPISRDKKHDNFIKKEEVSTETGTILTDKELELLFETLRSGNAGLKLKSNDRLYLYCQLLYFTGARPDAILTLQVNDISFRKHTVQIKPMKLASDYSQPLRAEVEELLIKWIELHDLSSDDYIFYPTQVREKYIDSTGKEKVRVVKGIIDKTKHTRYEAMRSSGKKYFDRLFNGVTTNKMDRISFYTLRRTGATKIYKKQGLAHASKFLYHSDIRTTMRYLGIDGDLKESINVL